MSTEVGQELCPSCARTNPTGTHFCRQCGAPLTSHAVTDPYLSVFAEGFAIRRAVASPDKPLVLIGVWLLGIPALFGVIAPLLSDGTVLGVAAAFGAFALWVAIVYKTTRNYLRLRQARQTNP